MAIRTSVFDIQIDPLLIAKSDECQSLVDNVQGALKKLDLRKAQEVPLGKGKLYIFINNANNLVCTLKLLECGVLSINIDEWAATQTITNQVAEQLRLSLQDQLEKKVERIPVMCHGSAVPRFFTTSDDRCLEYDFDGTVVDVTSPYQNIKILHSPTLGNCLFLDDLQNLGECDLSYTHGLMHHDKYSYKGKNILILGGGDGGLLHELLKDDPKFVTMVDIDQQVLDLCRQHLRGACGDTLDTMETSKYKIIVDDCVKMLNLYISENRTFDIVFNDLTDIPISTAPQGELWDFIDKILRLSLQVMHKDSKYLNHATGEGAKAGLASYEELLNALPVKVHYESHKTYVPSFMENWVFYELWKEH